MSSPPVGDALAPASTVPPADNSGTSSSSTPPVNGTSSAAGPPSPAILLLPPPPDGNGSVFGSPPPPPSGSSNNNTTLVALGVGIGIGGTIVLVCVGIFVLWYKRRKRRLGLDGVSHHAPSNGPKDDPFRQPQYHRQQNAPLPANHVVDMFPKPIPPFGAAPNSHNFSDGSTPPPPLSVPSSMSSDHAHQRPPPDSGVAFTKVTFTYRELALATDEFSSTNLLGQGGFGYVYKGVLQDGKEVAVKQLKFGSGQGEREFQAEVDTISRVHHKHLVLLVGYCISGDQRLLVYEFVRNRTLEFHLHGKDCPPLNWENRMKIALGSAKGLAYLHEDCQPKIIHRDIKAANILLDNDFEAKVADFGLARFYSDTDTHVSTRVMGTFGYLAPEYALTGKLTEKSDVFSFGVMLLELITGRRPIDKAQHYLDDNIVDWARPLLTQALEEGKFDTLADPRLQKNYDTTEMTRMVACAAVCVRHLARRRPSMSQILRALEGNIPLDELNEGLRPGQSAVYSSYGSADYDNTQYKEDLKKFRKMALDIDSQDQNNSDYSGPTSDFGHQPSGSSSEGQRTSQEMWSKNAGQQVVQASAGVDEDKHF